MTDMMRAYVIKGPRHSEIDEIARFSPEPGEAVVRTAAAAICTTERRIYTGTLPIPYPVIGGHELSGTIEEINGKDTDLRAGDRVAVDAIGRCGGCHYCVTGYSNLCARAYSSGRNGYRVVGGGFAEFVTISAKRLFKVPGEISLNQMALAEPASCVLRSISRSGLKMGDVAVVIGAGTMGALHVLLAQKLGVQVMSVELDDSRLKLARALGATWTVNPTKENAVEKIKSLTDGRGADVVFIAASSKPAGELALQLVGKTGRVLFFAATHPPEEITVPWTLLHHKEVSLVGTVGKTENEFRQATALLASGAIDVGPIISKTISIEDLDRELSVEGVQDAYRVIVVHESA